MESERYVRFRTRSIGGAAPVEIVFDLEKLTYAQFGSESGDPGFVLLFTERHDLNVCDEDLQRVQDAVNRWTTEKATV
jgi:hypothetical protein